MSETLNVRATFTATDEASPVVLKLIAEIRKLENVAKRFNSSFNNVSASMSGFADRMARDVSRITTVNRASARRFESDWSAATASRLSEAQRMYSHLERMERSYQRDLRQSENLVRRSAGASRSMPAARLPAPRLRSMVIGGAIGGAAIASAFKSRIGVNKAETAAEMFADMTGEEVKKLRKSFADVAGIKYGVGTSAALNAFTEGAKAGIPKEHGQVFADLALKAGAGLDLDFGATSKLLGRIATLKGNYSQDFLYGALNSIAVANNATAADAGEIVDATRRSLSALTSTKMDIKDLAAFNASGVSIGMQPQKTGTFIGFLTSELAGAGSARGQRAKDLNRAANMLGFGGRGDIARRMIDSPTRTLLTMFERLQAMPEAQRSNVATLIGRTEWRDELMALSGARDLIARSIKEIADKPKFLDEASLKKIRSLEGRWNSIAAAFGLVWEKIGAGLENIFTQVSDWIIEFAAKFNFNSIRERVNALIDGLKEGFGITDIGKSLTEFADSFSSSDVQRWKEFGKGFAEGVSGFIAGIKEAFSLVSGIVGKGDAGTIGKLIAQFAALSVALAALNPVIGVMSSIAGLAMSLAGLSFFLGGGGAGAAAGAAGAGIASRLGMLGPLGAAIAGTLFGGNRIIKNKESLDWLKQWQKDHGYGNDELLKKQSYLGNPEEAGKLFKRAAFESDGGFAGLVHKTGLKTSIDNLRDEIGRISSDIRPAALTTKSGGYGSFFGSDGGSASGNPMALLKNIPGTKLPDFGMTSRGIIGGSVGGMNRASYEKMFAGTPLAGKYDQITAAAKANGISPALLASVMAHESGRGKFLSGNNPGGIMDPATGWSRKMQFGSLDDGINKTASTVAKNWNRAGGDLGKLADIYAPRGAANDPRGLNGHWLGGVRGYMGSLQGNNISTPTGDIVATAEKYLGLNEYRDTAALSSFLGRDPRGRVNAWCARFVNKALSANGIAGTGSDAAKSFKNWGEAVRDGIVKRNDIMVRDHHVGFATGNTKGDLIEMLSGNSSDAVRKTWEPRGKYMLRRGPQLPEGEPLTAVVPSPSETIQNVPPASAMPGSGQWTMNGGGSGQVAIHINGSNHDPEALAALVQKRVNESMNWRTHDVHYSMT